MTWPDWADFEWLAAPEPLEGVAAPPRAKRTYAQSGTHPLFDPRVPEWMDRGLCADDPYGDMWFPHREGAASSQLAVEVCNRCPVRPQCAAYAQQMVDAGSPVGIWGGTTTHERKALREKAA